VAVDEVETVEVGLNKIEGVEEDETDMVGVVVDETDTVELDDSDVVGVELDVTEGLVVGVEDTEMVGDAWCNRETGQLKSGVTSPRKSSSLLACPVILLNG